MGIPDQLNCLLRNLFAGQEATVRSGHGTTAGSKLGKEWIKAVYCHPAYLTYMQCTSCEMPDWMKHKLQSRWEGEISTTSDMQITPPYGRKQRRTLDESERGQWKSWLKTQHSKNKDHDIQSHHFMEIDCEIMETVSFSSLGLQNHCRWWLQPWN